MNRSYVILCAIGFAVLLGSCKSRLDAETNPQQTYEASTDGLHVSLSISSEEITTSEMLQVELLVRSNESMKVQLPELSGKWGDFFVFDTKTTPAKLSDDGMVVHGVIYTLEPDISGESSLSELTVKAVAGNGKEVTLSTAPVSVKVSSVLKSGENSIRDIAPNERAEVVRKSPRWIIAVFVANVVIALCLIIVWLTWKKRQVAVLDHSLDDFVSLKSVSAAEVISRIERVVCQAIAKQKNIKLPKVDFAGLHAALEKSGIEVSGLPDATSQYEKIQYASHGMDEGEVRALYKKFAAIIDETGKGASS